MTRPPQSITASLILVVVMCLHPSAEIQPSPRVAQSYAACIAALRLCDSAVINDVLDDVARPLDLAAVIISAAECPPGLFPNTKSQSNTRHCDPALQPAFSSFPGIACQRPETPSDSSLMAPVSSLVCWEPQANVSFACLTGNGLADPCEVLIHEMVHAQQGMSGDTKRTRCELELEAVQVENKYRECRRLPNRCCYGSCALAPEKCNVCIP